MERPLKIMTEASGSLASAYMLKAVREAGHIPVGSDIMPWTPALALADEQIVFPRADDPGVWDVIESELKAHKIDVVLPSFYHSLLEWAERRDYFAERGVTVIVSSPQTMKIFLDKWLTYEFFREHGIPCPATSLKQEYPLIKPRLGSGAKGIYQTDQPTEMSGNISQAIAQGTEYTVDCLFDRFGQPIYIVPRRRALVRDGKSTQGETVEMPVIAEYIRHIARITPFVGMINFQCFVDDDGRIQFIECNPRLAGGMALGFAATENWIGPLINNLMTGQPIVPKPVRYGVRMIRYYAELFIYPD
ncbi:MAG: ATP-grasp domain-containing protein [Deltaproteobacteria bacterium]|jgi:carbamoyl-phosphate synthase large subunit|nr:ATP-grasp domain-containing protein [Deltaproteobacteria bacterium]